MASTLWAEPWEGDPQEDSGLSPDTPRATPAVGRRRSRKSLPATPTPLLGLPAPMRYLGANRRFLPRVRRPFQVRMPDSDRWVDGIDISFGGMMCVAEEAVWPGNLIEVELRLGDDPRSVGAVGRVVELVNSRGELAMRVRFEQVTASDRRRIAVWMAG